MKFPISLQYNAVEKRVFAVLQVCNKSENFQPDSCGGKNQPNEQGTETRDYDAIFDYVDGGNNV